MRILNPHSLKTQKHQDNLSSLLKKTKTKHKYLQLFCLDHVSRCIIFVLRGHMWPHIGTNNVRLIKRVSKCLRLSKCSFKTTRGLAEWFPGPSIKTNLIKNIEAKNDPAAVVNCASLAGMPGCSLFVRAWGPNLTWNCPHNAVRFISFFYLIFSGVNCGKLKYVYMCVCGLCARVCVCAHVCFFD